MSTDQTLTSRAHHPESLEAYWDIDRIVKKLSEVRQTWRSANANHAEYGPEFVRLHNEDVFVANRLQTALHRLYGQIRQALIYTMADAQQAEIGYLPAAIGARNDFWSRAQRLAVSKSFNRSDGGDSSSPCGSGYDRIASVASAVRRV